MGGGPAGSLLAPSLAGSPRVQAHRDFVIKTLLHGLTGPIAGTTYPQVMIPMGTQSDQWVADIGSYIRNAFGNTGTFISPSDVARVRAESKDRTTPWTAAEIEGALPVLMQSHVGWKTTASHNSVSAAQGLTLAGWTSAEPQRAGMWFQVELPEAVPVTEVQFDAAGGGRLGGGGGNRGRGGRGAPPAAAASTDGAEVTSGRGAASARAATGYWVRAAVPRRGFRRRHDVAASGRGFGCSLDDSGVSADAGEVRANYTDGGRARRAAVGRAELAGVQTLRTARRLNRPLSVRQ